MATYGKWRGFSEETKGKVKKAERKRSIKGVASASVLGGTVGALSGRARKTRVIGAAVGATVGSGLAALASRKREQKSAKAFDAFRYRVRKK